MPFLMDDPITMSTLATKQVIFGGDSMNLICSTEGLPQPEISWSLNGTQVEQRGAVLTIKAATAVTDAGHYMCKARNQYGETNRTIVVSVVHPPQLPEVQVLEAGQPLSLPCVDPRPFGGSLQVSNFCSTTSSLRTKSILL